MEEVPLTPRRTRPLRRGYDHHHYDLRRLKWTGPLFINDIPSPVWCQFVLRSEQRPRPASQGLRRPLSPNHPQDKTSFVPVPIDYRRFLYPVGYPQEQNLPPSRGCHHPQCYDTWCAALRKLGRRSSTLTWKLQRASIGSKTTFSISTELDGKFKMSFDPNFSASETLWEFVRYAHYELTIMILG